MTPPPVFTGLRGQTIPVAARLGKMPKLESCAFKCRSKAGFGAEL